MKKSSIYRWIIVVGMTACCLSGCLNNLKGGGQKKNAPVLTPPEKNQLSQKTVEKRVDPVSEVEQLLSQPYIDPLTRYCKRYAGDSTRLDQLERIEKERQRRCEKVAKDYQKLGKTTANLTKMSAGYGFSCPQQVEAFAALVTDPTYSECYLLVKLHNYREALEPCHGPAQNGDIRSQLNMAIISRELGDYKAALHWAALSAKYFPEAAFLMGELHANGQGTVQCDAKAVEWYEQSAEKNYAAAQTALGKMYLHGTGVNADPVIARDWLLKAARQNDPEAFFYLGEMCEQESNSRDLPQAMVWYDFAFQKGMQEARDRLQVLSKTTEMTKIQEAQMRVSRMLKAEDK